MLIVAIVAHRAVNLGHRLMKVGETFAQVRFLSEEDAKFFKSRLNWSAFRYEDVKVDGETPELSPKQLKVIELDKAVADHIEALAVLNAVTDAAEEKVTEAKRVHSEKDDLEDAAKAALKQAKGDAATQAAYESAEAALAAAAAVLKDAKAAVTDAKAKVTAHRAVIAEAKRARAALDAAPPAKT
jgi:hypothetical protein